ncbi:hypothetical protein QYE76_059287 [Lolium multiflorum]|uniref:Uncharacterized protein n=1 Tax=Lolium multiflorum TaxID=4521 RepID=A0AAD8PHW3_LOLMU|nr:hypothetical protein QYE76_059287 [Lolium multiflorum]
MAGFGGRRGGRGRRGRGRGRRAGAASPSRSSSPAPSLSSEEATCFEFILRIDQDPLGIKRLPDKFAEFVDGVEPAGSYGRRAATFVDGVSRYCSTPRDVPAHRWDKFARYLDLEPGCRLSSATTDGDMVVVFDGTSCRRYYHISESSSSTDS